MAARSSASKTSALRITAPLVAASIGTQVLQFSYGDVLPEGVSEEAVKHLKSLGYVEEVDASESDDN